MGRNGPGYVVTRRGALRLGRASVAAGAALGLGVGALAPSGAEAQTLGDIDLLNFILNVEYLNTQYTGALAGVVISPTRLTGNGVPGVPATGGRSLIFTDLVLGQIVTEMANDSHNHLLPIRVIIGALAIRQPSIDIAVSPTAAFSVAMQRAGVVAPGTAFDPYASDENALYALFLLKNISVAAYRGLAAAAVNRVVTQNFTGLMGAEAIHLATIRSYLYTRGATTPRFRQNADKIAAFQRSLNGAQAYQALSPATRAVAGGPAAVQVANIAPAAANGQVAGRTAAQTLNQLYLTASAATAGGFFPEGVNGTLRASDTTA